jgi:DNA polymerase-3 subunit alpha
MESAIAEREKKGLFRTLEDFCSRLDSRAVNKKFLESLVKCGAFDCVDKNRAALFAEVEPSLSAAASLQRDRASGQFSLFGDTPLTAPKKSSSAARIEPWSNLETLKHEKELLGYYVSGHPLDSYAGNFDSGKYNTIAQAREATEPGTFKLAGLIMSVEKRFSKKDGKPFGILILEDFTGSLEITAWDESFSKNAALFVAGTAVSINTRITRRDEAIRATAGAVAALKEKTSVRPVRLRLARERLDEPALQKILAAVQANPGPRPLILEFVLPNGRSLEMPAGEEFAIGDERELVSAVNGLVVA